MHTSNAARGASPRSGRWSCTAMNNARSANPIFLSVAPATPVTRITTWRWDISGGNSPQTAKMRRPALSSYLFREVDRLAIQMVRSRGLEPPRVLPHSDLNAARLPIPPRPHVLTWYGGRLAQPKSEGKRKMHADRNRMRRGALRPERGARTGPSTIPRVA